MGVLSFQVFYFLIVLVSGRTSLIYASNHLKSRHADEQMCIQFNRVSQYGPAIIGASAGTVATQPKTKPPKTSFHAFILLFVLLRINASLRPNMIKHIVTLPNICVLFSLVQMESMVPVVLPRKNCFI